MKPAIPYLALPGTCREAMSFYRDTFGGEITIMQTMGESELDFPAEAADMIFNSELVSGDFVLKASDNPSREDPGSTISIFVTLTDATAQAEMFAKLAEGGVTLFEVRDGFGMCRDRFGVQWMLALAADG